MMMALCNNGMQSEKFGGYVVNLALDAGVCAGHGTRLVG
jgi:hypothetical protein